MTLFDPATSRLRWEMSISKIRGGIKARLAEAETQRQRELAALRKHLLESSAPETVKVETILSACTRKGSWRYEVSLALARGRQIQFYLGLTDRLILVADCIPTTGSIEVGLSDVFSAFGPLPTLEEPPISPLMCGTDGWEKL